MKKIKAPEKRAGIWLDQQTAYIISVEGRNEPQVETVSSGIISRVREKGEGQPFTRIQTTFVNEEEKKQHREQEERKKYYKEILHHLHAADFIYLLGPSRSKFGLRNAILKAKDLEGVITGLETAPKMTAEEARRAVMNYFNGMAFKSFKRQWRYEKRKAGSIS